jgi:hypothetical protein
MDQALPAPKRDRQTKVVPQQGVQLIGKVRYHHGGASFRCEDWWYNHHTGERTICDSLPVTSVRP